jgi:hypothetical protein
MLNVEVKDRKKKTKKAGGARGEEKCGVLGKASNQ